MNKELIKSVKDVILDLEPSAEVILYGSRARNDCREYSDCDFLVLVDGPVDNARTDRIRGALYEIELDTDQIISSIVRSRQDWKSPKYSVVPLRKNIEQEGDYEVFVSFNETDVKPWLEETERFVNSVIDLIKQAP